MKCYNCNKETKFKQENITFKDNLEVLMCDDCVKEYRAR